MNVVVPSVITTCGRELPPWGKNSWWYASNMMYKSLDERSVGTSSVPTPDTCSHWRVRWNSVWRFLNSRSLSSPVWPPAFCPTASQKSETFLTFFFCCQTTTSTALFIMQHMVHNIHIKYAVEACNIKNRLWVWILCTLELPSTIKIVDKWQITIKLCTFQIKLQYSRSTIKATNVAQYCCSD